MKLPVIVCALVASSLAFAADASAQATMERTPNIGIEFRQDDQLVPLTPGEPENGHPVFTITLRPEAFELSIPNSSWRAPDTNHYIALAVSTDPAFLTHLRFDQPVYDTDFLGVFRAMAFDPADLGGLLTAERPLRNGQPDYGFNSLGDHRFAAEADRRILRISSIDDRATFEHRLVDGVTATLVFYLDRDSRPGERAPLPNADTDVVRREDVDIVRVTFAAP